MPGAPSDSLAIIQSLSAAERQWQPPPEAFLRMVEAPDPAAQAQSGSPLIGLAVERHLERYVWILLKGTLGADGARLTELARASEGDGTRQQAWMHGLQALRVMGAPLP